MLLYFRTKVIADETLLVVELRAAVMKTLLRVTKNEMSLSSAKLRDPSSEIFKVSSFSTVKVMPPSLRNCLAHEDLNSFNSACSS
jgi:hypothetical protein